MVCRRCVMTVEDICSDLGIMDATVSLGSVTFPVLPDSDLLNLFYDRLRAVGFEPLKSHEHVMLENIKAAVRYYARHSADNEKSKLSDYMNKAVNMDFRYASRMFSSLEGRTIQSYLMAQRIEYVKELLFDDELTLAEIADKVGFSSVAHLSHAFKKTQGITISEFRDAGMRIGIDEV
ncbi:helix-turn-helix transcriptional regulator [uncultured Bacteroides sp.]|nr:helix-turn-helix transcriptional regulator [uncultured Bacteroides sp.]